jgi:signal transduction histidine kinase
LTLAERVGSLWRRYRVEVCWWIFVLINVAGILIFREWATVPFHFIWISLTLLYGWRVWAMRPTSAALAAVIVVTGVSLGADVVSGDQAPDELAEIPLMSAVFAAMVLFVRRAVAAREEISHVYEHNVVLLEYARHLVRHASHIVRTPLTIALGHAEILQRTTDDAVAARDAGVVIDELTRLKETTDRLLELATSHQPDFVRPVLTPLREVVADACDHWSAKGAPVRLGKVDDAAVRLDPDRLLEALDELIGNAVTQTASGTIVEVSTRREVEASARHEDGREVIEVADRGPGIREDDEKPLFDRFAAADGNRKRGARLGLAIVRAIAEAHGGSVAVRDRPGGGAVVELRLPREGPGHEPAGAAIAPAGAAVAPVNAAMNRRPSLPAYECPDGLLSPPGAWGCRRAG